MTIDELMDGKQPGEIKIALTHWGKASWFQPYFKDENGDWHGVLEDKTADKFYYAYPGWNLYEEGEQP
jgi:hypothetical protein